MKKIVRLTESDLSRIVRRVIKENETSSECEHLFTEMEYIFNDFMSMLKISPNEIDPEEFYDDLESELGAIIDLAYENDCDKDTTEYMENAYGEYLHIMAQELEF